MYPWAPFAAFGVGASLAGLGTVLLPETRGQTLPDTVAELEERLKKRRERSTVVAAADTPLSEYAQLYLTSIVLM